MKTSKTLRQLIVLVLISFTFMQVSAKGKHKFSGSWNLNIEESILSTQFSLAPSKVVITQEKKSINIIRYTRLQGEDIAIEEKLTLDGKACENSGFQGSKKVSEANWSDDKKSIIVTSELESSYGLLTIREVLSLVDKKLKVEYKLSSYGGDLNETWILEKEDK